jgi:phospholipid-binding lipoprotein MlaA
LAPSRLLTAVCFLGLALSLSACSSLSGAVRADSASTIDPASRADALRAGPPRAIEAAAVSDVENSGLTIADDMTTDAVSGPPPADSVPQVPMPVSGPEPRYDGMAQARSATDAEPEEYDPWERFNETMFDFNRRLDRYVLKPVAKGYNFVVPDEVQIMISNGFDNISFVPRLVNSLLQGKFSGAGREVGRFVINSTVGVGGLFDPAKDVFGLTKSREDFGQTLCTYGTTAGPYVIVPFFEPLTVRDGVGKAVDAFMDPLSYVLPLVWDRLAMKVGDIVNERSLNLDLFQGFEESVIDMYSAVRHAYLQRRERMCRE